MQSNPPLAYGPDTPVAASIPGGSPYVVPAGKNLTCYVIPYTSTGAIYVQFLQGTLLAGASYGPYYFGPGASVAFGSGVQGSMVGFLSDLNKPLG